MTPMKVKPKKPKLKPCPFCGGKAKIYQDIELHWAWVSCSECDSVTAKWHSVKGEHIKAASEIWNKRHE
jgi:Lar family restriction alleviation protein